VKNKEGRGSVREGQVGKFLVVGDGLVKVLRVVFGNVKKRKERPKMMQGRKSQGGG